MNHKLLGLCLAAVTLAVAPLAAGQFVLSWNEPRNGFELAGLAHGTEGGVVEPLRLLRRAFQEPETRDDAPAPYNVDFRCPSTVWSRPEEQAQIENEICPMHILDPEDILSQPLLVVDPFNPDIIAFSALHGGRGLHVPEAIGGHDPPSERSRHNRLHQPHTTFQSVNGGAQFNDNRFYAPASLTREGRDVFGEDNAITLDGNGRLYVGALYGWRDSQDPGYHYSVAVWKGQRGNRDMNYFEAFQVLPRDPTYDRMDNLHLAFSRDADRVLVMWRQNRTDLSAGAGGPGSWAEFYVTAPGEGARWTPQPMTQRVGPCRAITNPLEYGGLFYFGCLPDHGYAFGRNTTADLWQIHTIDPVNLATHYVAPVPIATPYGRLVERGHTGYMLFVGSGVVQGGSPSLQISEGALGKNWADPEEFGEDVRGDSDGAPLADARVTAAAFTHKSSYLHLLYLERYEVNKEDPEGQSKRTLYKSYAVIRPTAGFQGNFDDRIDYGAPETRVQFGLAYQGGLNELVFDDLHDGIVTWVDPGSGKERIWTTFGDYGYVRFAEVVQQNFLPAIPLPPIAPPPIPIAAQAANTAVQGVAAGALTILMLLRLMTAKRRTTTKVEA